MTLFDAMRKMFASSSAAPNADEPIAPARSADSPPQESRDFLHDYWRTSQQSPVGYAEADPRRSEYLVELVKNRITPDARILELGTNVGRNLHYLRAAGFSNLEGIEISPIAVEELRSRYPDLADVNVHVGPIEEFVPRYGDREFDCIYTMAVLEHIHADSEWIFAEIARIAGTLITIEEEAWTSVRHFPRDYRQVFESLGMRQVYELPVDELFVAEELGRSRGIQARVFVHADDA